jgi:spermidine/putrescine transport system permease protein
MSLERPRVLATITWAYLAWSLVPVAYAIRAAFSATAATPPEGVSLESFRFIFRNRDFTAAMLQSVKLGLITVALAVPLGTSMALALRHLPGRGWRWVGAGLLAGIALPSIALAMILLYLFAFVVHIGLTTQAQVIAHITIAIPFVTLVILLRLATLEEHIEEQALDLGAPPNDVVRRVLLPMLGPAVGVACAVAFTLSFNDLVLSRALCFPNECRTVPMFLYGARGIGDPPPSAFALALVAMAVSGVVVFAGAFALARRRTPR